MALDNMTNGNRGTSCERRAGIFSRVVNLDWFYLKGPESDGLDHDNRPALVINRDSTDTNSDSDLKRKLEGEVYGPQCRPGTPN